VSLSSDGLDSSSWCRQSASLSSQNVNTPVRPAASAVTEGTALAAAFCHARHEPAIQQSENHGGGAMTISQSAPQATSAIDAFAPGEIARRLEAANVSRAGLPAGSLLLLGLVGGVYISFGGAMATLVLTDSGLGYGLGRLAAGLSFSLGLIMLVVAGGELFTGNNLMVLAFAGRKISAGALARNWVLVYAANAAGAVLLAFAIHLSGILDGNGVKATAVRIAEAKAQLDMPTAFLRGVLCNMLVCLAVWLSVAARSVEGKVVAIAFPISAFVALGFEHCIANFYLLPLGMLSGAQVSLADLAANVGAVTLGNALGGVVITATWYAIYLGRDEPTTSRFVDAAQPALTAQPVASLPAAASIAEPPPAAVEEMRVGEVRLRLKSERGRPVAAPAEPTIVPASTSVITRPVMLIASGHEVRAEW
jgi:formate/nitrite transporter